MTRLLALCVGLVAVAPPASAADRPNFLFVITDDQAAQDLSVYDDRTTLETPRLAALAARGVTLDAAYHQGAWRGAVCVTSRTMLMTGRTVWHVPGGQSDWRWNEDGRGQVPVIKPDICPPDIADYSLPAVFDRAGYLTMRTCKNENSYMPANAKFAVRRDRTMREGNDERGSAWHADQVIDFLNRRDEAGSAAPFLIYLGFSHPHDPRNGKEDLLAKYGAENRDDPPADRTVDPASPPLPENYLPAHPFPRGDVEVRDEFLVEGVYDRRDEATVRNEIGRNHACTENIDIELGRVLDRLEERGELGNTYVFFTSDHGIAVGRHGLMGKQSLYEHCWRVPFLAAGPDIPEGVRAPGFVYLLDVLPTLCDLAGIDIPETAEGISFAPVLRGERRKVRDTLYGVYSGEFKPGLRSVRRGDWKLIKYDSGDGLVNKTQLFNLAENRDELLLNHHLAAVERLTGNDPARDQRNLADDPAYAEKRTELESLLEAEMIRHDDPYRMWDQVARDEL